MTETLFRLAVTSDIAALHQLIESAYRGDSARGGWTHEADLLDGQRTDVDALTNLIADPAQRLIVADLAEQLTGCVQITDKGGGLAYLGMLSVAPGLQGGGLGRQLIEAAESRAIALFSAKRMEMAVIRQRAELIAYYERRGYALTGEERPFPYGDARFGVPRTGTLAFVVLARDLG